jgi:hypothetical protein
MDGSVLIKLVRRDCSWEADKSNGRPAGVGESRLGSEYISMEFCIRQSSLEEAFGRRDFDRASNGRNRWKASRVLGGSGGGPSEDRRDAPIGTTA